VYREGVKACILGKADVNMLLGMNICMVVHVK
jgi:hypothetical protein